MRVKLDENLPDSAITLLDDAGHDVDTARAERGFAARRTLQGCIAVWRDGELRVRRPQT